MQDFVTKPESLQVMSAATVTDGIADGVSDAASEASAGIVGRVTISFFGAG
jgi:hypothetical protein